MRFFRRIEQWFSNSPGAKQPDRLNTVRELLNEARRAQYAENYDEALELLTRAMDMAESNHDIRKQIDITLSRADILIAKKDYDTAHFVLTELRDDTTDRQLNAPLAYCLCSLGILEQIKGNLTSAQDYFETARKKATMVKADGAWGRAIAHLGDTYLAQGNAIYAEYLLEDAVKRLNRSGDRELLGYFLGQLGLAKIQIGHGEQGKTHIKQGLDLAITINHRAQMRHLNHLLGQHALDNGNTQQAQNYFVEALGLYPEPAPQTEDYARLLCQLSKIYLHTGHLEDAKHHAKEALTVAEVLSNQALIAMSKAMIALTLFTIDDDATLSLLKEATKTYDNIEPDSFYIEVRRTMATAKINSGDIEGGITDYRDVIEKAQNHPLEVALAHRELANHYTKNRDFRIALDEWQNAIRQYERIHQTEQIALAHCEVAGIHDRLGDGRMAQREYGMALEMVGQIKGTKTKGIILATIARVYSHYGDVESAQDFFKQSIEIAGENNDPEAIVSRHTDYAQLLALMNQGEKARSQLEQAQQICDDSGLDSQMAMIQAMTGLSYAIQGENTTAVEHYQDAMSRFKSLNDSHSQAMLHVLMGDTALNVGNISEAEQHFETADELAQSNQQVDVLIRASLGKAKLAIHNDDFDSTNKILSDIEPIARRLNYPRLLANLHETWSRYYAKQGNNDKAKSEWDEAQRLQAIMQMKNITPDWLN